MAGYQIKVNMEYVKPPMWRRMAIPDQITFADLHEMLQIAFGWDNWHLHDFRFQHVEESVGDSENTDVEYDERDLLADGFLKDGWIRYTYDFGDDWCHKIVLEKELPDYEFRYPQVLKFKRNNFKEDSGGAWSEEEQGEYDMAEVNARLKEACFCPVPDSGTYKTIQDLDEERVDFREYMEQRKEEAKAIEEIRDWLHVDGEQGEYTELDEQLGLLEDFYEQADIIRFGDKRRKGPRKCTIKRSKRIMEQQFYLIDETGLKDYLKYLGQPEPKNATVVNMARQISNVLKEHPEYLCMVLEEDEIRTYLTYYHGSGRMDLPDQDLISVCAMWGLAEFEIADEELQLSFPADIDSIAAWMEQEDLSERYKEMHSTWKHISSLLACYGYVELDALYDAYICAFGDMDPTEFKRYLYLAGTFCGRIMTGVMPDGIAWAALDAKMAIAAVAGQGEYAADLQYAKFTKTQVLNMEAGFGKLYPQWDKVLDLLCRLGMDERVVVELINQLYEAVVCGGWIEELMGVVRELLPEDVEGGDMIRLRRALENCWCEMGIAVLKGHSRREIAEERGISPLEVASGTGESGED